VAIEVLLSLREDLITTPAFRRVVGRWEIYNEHTCYDGRLAEIRHLEKVMTHSIQVRRIAEAGSI
jgi:hypothetical protein